MKVILLSLLVVLLTIATLAVVSMAVLDNNRKAQKKAEIIFSSLFIIVFLGGLITLIMYFYASLIFGYSM
jgi:hypothetical protein